MIASFETFAETTTETFDQVMSPHMRVRLCKKIELIAYEENLNQLKEENALECLSKPVLPGATESVKTVEMRRQSWTEDCGHRLCRRILFSNN